MPAPNGTGSLTLTDIGARLRAMREARDISQADLAGLLKCSQPTLSKYEAGKLAMAPDMRRTAEWVLAIADDGHSMANAPYLTLEQSATCLRTWEGPLVPGLLQTADYARCVLGAASPGMPSAELDQQVALRVKRQEIWQRAEPPPPVFAAVIGEAALRRLVGTPAVMREQLEHLAGMSEHPHISVQVLPFDAGGSVGLLSSFVLASFPSGEQPDAAYLDETLSGRTTDKRASVAKLRLLFDALAREAKRPGDSIQMIREVAARWT